MKSLTLFLQQVLHESGDLCGTSTSRDSKTITTRVEHEGISFYTITLPKFAEDFQKSLAQRMVTDDLFLGYKKRGKLPEFLGGFLRMVFNETTGELLDGRTLPDGSTPIATHVAIRAIRQITLLYSKVLLPASDLRTAKAFQKYIECEQDVRDSDRRLWSSNSFEDFCLSVFGIFFTEGCLTTLSESSETLASDRFMDLVRLLIGLEETLSGHSKFGPGVLTTSSQWDDILRQAGASI